MEKTPTSKKKRRVRGALCAAFAAAVLVSGGGYALASQGNNSHQGNSQQKKSNQNNAASTTEPGTVQAFGGKATQESQSTDPYASNWDSMVQAQAGWMQDQKYAGPFNSFLAQYDQFRGQSLAEMANNVNTQMLSQITYSDTLYGQADDYWATPIETAMNRQGDCKDQAILQYYIMRHLGVPENRLFVAVVDAIKSDNYGDHAVLLLNTAPYGQPESFVVMNDGGAVVNSNQYENSNTLPQGWPDTYTFYDARNTDGFWATKYSNDSVGEQVSNNAVTAKTIVAVSQPPGLPKMTFRIG